MGAVAVADAPVQAPADPRGDGRRDRLAGDRPVPRGQDGEPRGRQRDRQARDAEGVLRRAEPGEDRRADRRLDARRRPAARRGCAPPRTSAAVARPPAAVQDTRDRARPAATAGDRELADRRARRAHRPAGRRQADGDQAVRPGARQPRVPRDGPARAAVHPELRLRVRLPARDPGRGADPLRHLLVAAPAARSSGRLRHQLGRAVDDLRAARASALRPPEMAGPVCAPPTRGRRRVREHRRRRHPHGLGVRQRAPARPALGPHPRADRVGDAAGDRPRRRTAAPGGASGRRRARVRRDP